MRCHGTGKSVFVHHCTCTHTHMCVAKARNAWSSLQVAEMVCLFARAGNHLHAAEARTPNFGMNCSFCIVWV